MTSLPTPSMTRCCIVIPARLASSRLPRKMLLRETGKSLIQHTYEAALLATLPEKVIVATDHAEIQNEVLGFGGNVQMTSPDCTSGTDRVAEIAAAMPEIGIFINVQGDEPEISAETIDLVGQLLIENPGAAMATVANPIRSRRQLEDSACVKVVLDKTGRALYFSRSVIPHPRSWNDTMLDENPPRFLQHVGLYAYRREFLLQFAAWPSSLLERTESLEQLRVLEAGYAIIVGIAPEGAGGIDTPGDYRAFVERQGRC